MDSIWITWEVQRRNRSLASALGAELIEFDYKGSRMSRYALLTRKTLTALYRANVDIVFVENPSIVLSTLVVLWGKFSRSQSKTVIDCHNCGIVPKHFKTLARWLAKHADACIVTNDAMAMLVSSWGGHPLVMPDPLPKLNPAQLIELSDPSILFICSWAADEPIDQMLSAAKMLADKQVEVTIYITGRPEPEKYPATKALPSNVILTGYLSEEEFDGYLLSCDAVLDLTTRDDCMVCGAYEGVAAEKPLLLSNNKATAAYFTSGVELTDNTAIDIYEKLVLMLSQLKTYQKNIVLMKALATEKQSTLLAALKQELGISLN
jgi:glycosyltransferase involved in cell wall biosynthesis